MILGPPTATAGPRRPAGIIKITTIYLTFHVIFPINREDVRAADAVEPWVTDG
jgi:hypothetical protein